MNAVASLKTTKTMISTLFTQISRPFVLNIDESVVFVTENEIELSDEAIRIPADFASFVSAFVNPHVVDFADIFSAISHEDQIAADQRWNELDTHFWAGQFADHFFIDGSDLNPNDDFLYDVTEWNR